MKSKTNPADLTKFMHGLTTVFGGLQEMFSAVTDQIGQAFEGITLFEEAAAEVAGMAGATETEEEKPVESIKPVEPVVLKYTEPVQKPKTTRKRVSAKKASPVETISKEPVSKESVPVETEPVETTPIEPAPVEPVPSEEEPVEAEQKESEEDVPPFDVAPSTPSITKDMITKVVVSKIKMKRSNSEAIGKLVKAYGVAQLSDLPEDKYEAFLNDLSQL